MPNTYDITIEELRAAVLRYQLAQMDVANYKKLIAAIDNKSPFSNHLKTLYEKQLTQAEKEVIRNKAILDKWNLELEHDIEKSPDGGNNPNP